MLVVSSAALLNGCQPASSGDWNVKIGDPLPAFSLPDTSGATRSLDEFKGKPMVVNVFATWCGPCRAELPHVEKELWQAYKDKGLSVVAISTSEEAEEVKTFVQDMNLSMPVLIDSTGKYTGQLGGSSIPRALIVDKDHKIVHQEVGFSEPLFEKFVERVRKLL
jgi:peroxiredoxin